MSAIEREDGQYEEWQQSGNDRILKDLAVIAIEISPILGSSNVRNFAIMISHVLSFLGQRVVSFF